MSKHGSRILISCYNKDISYQDISDRIEMNENSIRFTMVFNPMFVITNLLSIYFNEYNRTQN